FGVRRPARCLLHAGVHSATFCHSIAKGVLLGAEQRTRDLCHICFCARGGRRGGLRRGARGLRHGNTDYRLLCRHVVRVSTPERRSERPQERRRLVGRLPPCVRAKRTTASTGPGAARARQPRAVMSNPAKAIPVLVLAVAVCACTELPSS